MEDTPSLANVGHFLQTGLHNQNRSILRNPSRTPQIPLAYPQGYAYPSLGTPELVSVVLRDQYNTLKGNDALQITMELVYILLLFTFRSRYKTTIEKAAISR